MNRGTKSWILYASLLVLFWGVWGAFSSEPNNRYGYPNEMIYIIWALTMLIPAYFAMRGKKFDHAADRRRVRTDRGTDRRRMANSCCSTRSPTARRT